VTGRAWLIAEQFCIYSVFRRRRAAPDYGDIALTAMTGK